MADIDITKLSEDELRQLQVALTPKMNKYIPITPTPKQTAALLMNSCRELLYGGAAGGGKDIELSTPVLTFNRGWQTMGTLMVGDYVFSITGRPTQIIWKSDIMHNPCYKLTFDKGREEFIAGKNHEWLVWRRRQDTTERTLEKITTEQIFSRFSNNAPKNRGSLYAIRVALPLQYAQNALPVDPYVLGVWLGDGCRQSGVVSAVDEEIRGQFISRGYDVYYTESCVQYDRPDIHPDGRLHHWCSARLRNELRQLGFLYNSYDTPVEKTIPDEYMQASYNDRLELLRGMMDTDGCAVDRPTGDVELTLANEHLATQFEELIRSLGMQVESKQSYDIRNDDRYPLGEYIRYRLNWTTGTPVFYLSRKLKKQAKVTPVTQQWHYISNIEPVETVPTQCIQVADAPNVYLVGKTLIPTHNSVLLLAAALQYVDTPGYSAILFRKTFSDLMLPGALIPMSHDWLSPFLKSGEVRWQDKEKRYTFLESGATLSFGYLDAKNDELRYQGAEFQFVGMDEVTHIDPAAYRYLFSRLRRLKGSNIPIRMRSSANPGGPHGEYYYQRFFVDKKGVFLSAGLSDNPHLDADEYRESLAELDPVTRKQLEDGDWEIRPKGDLFDKSWILEIDYRDLPEGRKTVRFWDLASIDPKYRKKNSNKAAPDWTIGFKLSFFQGCYYIEDISKLQKSPGEIEAHIAATAEADGASCAIRMEEEGGASGIANTERYSKKILVGYNFAGVKPVVSKIERARPVAAACQVGNVFISNRCRNITDFFTQLEGFPNGANDDIVDAFSGAFAFFKPKRSGVFSPPTHRERIDKTGTNQLLTTGSSYWHNPMNNR